VFAKIREDVDERIADGARRRERTAVPAVGPKAPVAPNELVHVASDTDGDALDAGRQRSLVARFDDEVHVIPLHGKVKYTKCFGTATCGRADGDRHGGKHVLAAKRTEE
jgi:hypothetical protein